MRNLSVVLFDKALRPYLNADKEIFGNSATYTIIALDPKLRSTYENNSLDKIYASTSAKIAVVEDNYDMSVAVNLSKFDAVVVISPEIIIMDNFVDHLRKKFVNSNVFAVVADKLKFYSNEEYVYYYPFLPLQVSRLNHHRPVDLLNKKKLFDCLLGSYKPHRAFIFENLKQCGLLNQCYVNLLSTNQIDGATKPKEYYRSPDLDADESAEALLTKQLNDNVFHSMQHVLGYGNSINSRISNQVPWDIYKNSHYSIIAETNNNSTFLTEKTGKALFAKRLFVMFGAHNHLKALQEFGFQTFSGILDESYDNIEDDQQRWAQAFEQVLWLSKQNPIEIYQQAHDILEYNYLKICDYELFITPLRTWLLEQLRTCIVDISFD